MKLSELKARIDATLEMKSDRELEVVVLVERGGAVGGSPSVPVRGAVAGFDWDSGKFMISTTEILVELSRKVKQKVMTNTEIKKYLYRIKPTAKLAGKTDKVYLYHADIDQHYISFRVPVEDMGETPFEDELPAQLLIRWMV